MRSTLPSDVSPSAPSHGRSAVVVAALLAMVATFVPALPAAAVGLELPPLPAGVRVDGVPATVAVGDLLSVRVTDTSAPGVESEVTSAQLSLPTSWELLDVASGDRPVVLDQFGTDVEGGLNFPSEGVRANRWSVTVGGGGSFATLGGEALFTATVRVGPTPVGGPFEVVDIVAFGNVEGSRNGFTRTTIEPTWDVREPNVVSTGATYPLAITNRSSEPADVAQVQLEVPDPDAVSVVSGPTPTRQALTSGDWLLTFDFPFTSAFGASVAPGTDAILLDVVATTLSRADGNGAGESIPVRIYRSNEATLELIQTAAAEPIVEHSVRVEGTGILEAGDVGSYSVVDARNTIDNDGFPNSTMGTTEVELALPAGVSYVPDSASVEVTAVTTGLGTVTFVGPFTTSVRETLFTFELAYDGSNPGVDQPIDVRSTPIAGAEVYDSTLRPAGDGKLFSIDLSGPVPWVLRQGGFTAQGSGAFVRLADDGTSGGPVVLEYDNRLSSGVGATISPAIEVTTTATTTGQLVLPYDFSGFHAFFAVRATLEAFVNDGEPVSLYDPEQQNCCTTPSAGFSTTGEARLAVSAGDTVGFRITGKNGDRNSRLQGRLVIGEPTEVVEYSAPGVALLAAARDLTPADGQLPSLDVLGRVTGERDTSYLLSFVGSSATSTACEATTPLGAPVPITTDGGGIADFGTTFTTDDTGAGALPERVAVVAVAQLEAVDFGEGSFRPEEVTRFDPSTGYEGSNCVYAGFGNDAWTSALTVGDGETVEDVIEQPGGTRWYRFPVRPNGQASIDLTDLPDDYDLAVFTDIDEEYVDIVGADDEDPLNRLGAEFAPSAFSPSAFSPSAFSPSAFSPSAFSPSAFSSTNYTSVYAPSAFSPSAFSPSAFSPSAFSPSAFSPSAFSPSAFSPSAFSDAGISPSAFSPSAFSPSAFSPSAFSDAGFAPSAFSPSAFSPSAFSPEAYASAQAQALITLSANPGTADEFAVVNTWNNDTSFYVRVAAKPGAADLAPFNLTVELEGNSCDEVSRNPAGLAALEPVDLTDGPFETVIVWDAGRLEATIADDADPDLPTPSDRIGAVRTSLNDLAAATGGVVVDLSLDQRVQRLQQQADENAQCVYAANLVANAIKDVIDSARSDQLRHVVLVGDDSVVPFFRYPDTALLGPESDYVPPVADNTRSQASLRENYILGQDQYGASTVLSLGGMQVPVPELAVGRLVETPEEIVGMVDQYLDPDPEDAAVSGPVPVRPDEALVVGYDFMTDAAAAIEQEFAKGIGVGIDRIDDLVAPANAGPGSQLEGVWNAEQLYDAWLEPAVKHDLVYLAGHFSANSALAADYETQLVTTQLQTDDIDLAGSIIFSNGCHSGYNIVDGDGEPGLTLGLDWAQVLAQKRATFIGGTGYQYGDTDLVEYSERLYTNFARELRRGSGEVAVGEAMVRAKREYLASTPDPRGLHRKSLLIATVFGLPMTGVDMEFGRFDDDTSQQGVTLGPDDVVGANPGKALGLQRKELTIGPNLTLGEETVTLDVLDASGNRDRQVDASYLTAPDGRTAVQPNEPILPLLSRDVTAQGTSLRGVAFRGGRYTDTPGVRPLSSAAGTELRGVHVPFASEVFFPMQIATANYYDALPGGQQRTRLLATPVQHRADGPVEVDGALVDDLATRRVFDALDVALFYSNNTATYPLEDGDGNPVLDRDGNPITRTPALAAPPRIGGVRFTQQVDDSGVATGNVLVDALVVGDPAAGVQSVWLTTTSGPDPVSNVGTWAPVDLARSATDTRRWTGVLPGAAAPGTSPLDVVVHAVSGVGLVTTDDNFGRYYQAGGNATPAPGEEPATRTSTQLTVTPRADSTVVNARVAIDVQLTTADGTAVENEPVLVTLGSGGATVVTNESGEGTVSLPAIVPPGSGVPITATFRGSDAFAPSSGDATIAVTKVVAELVLTSDGGGGVDITLTSATGAPLGEQAVRLLAGDDGQQLQVITAPDGTVNVPAGRFTAPSGPVTSRYLGNATTTGAGPVTMDRDPAQTSFVDISLPGDVVYGDSDTVSARLRTALGVAVGGVDVTVTVGSGADAVDTVVETSSTGVVSLDLASVTSETGGLAVTFDYAGDGVRFDGATAGGTIAVLPAQTMLVPRVEAAPVAGVPVGVTVELTSRSKPVKGEPISFTWDGNETTVVTGADGEATVVVTPLAGDVDLDVVATLAASPAYEFATTTATLNVTKQTTLLYVIDTAPVSPTASGVETNLYATLRGFEDREVVGRAVTLTVNSTPSGTLVVPGTTDGMGRLDLGVVDLPAGRYLVEADFAGDDLYSPSRGTGWLVIDARTSLEAVRARLLAADVSNFDKHDTKKVEKAIEWLDEAIDHSDWEDGRPTEDEVLKAVSKAVKALSKVDQPDAIALATPAIEMLWRTSRQVAVDEIEDAEQAGVRQKDIDKAYEELAKGDQELTDDKPKVDKAVKRWEKAFDKVVDDRKDREKRRDGE